MKFIKLHRARYDHHDHYIKGEEVYFSIDHIVRFWREPKEKEGRENYTFMQSIGTSLELLKIWEKPDEICSFLPYDLAGPRK